MNTVGKIKPNGRVGMAAAAMLALAWLATAPPARADEDLTEGNILVADRKLKDPNFAQAVVLIVKYGDHGALGLVLNRPNELSVSDLLAGVKAARDRSDPAFSGGPVEPMSVLALLRTQDAPQGAEHVAGDIYVIQDQDLLKDALVAHTGPGELRFYVGYTGWGPGQLEAEMEAGAWRVVRGSADTVFDSKPESLWNRLARNLDSTLARVFSPQPHAVTAPHP